MVSWLGGVEVILEDWAVGDHLYVPKENTEEDDDDDDKGNDGEDDDGDKDEDSDNDKDGKRLLGQKPLYMLDLIYSLQPPPYHC